MNKGDIINEVAKVVATKKQAKAAVDCFIETISNALEDKEAVTLVGFGTFKTVDRQKRQGKNPRTGKTITIPAKTAPKFVPGKSLKERVK